MKNPFHIMLIPTLGCPSKCSYCWSSEEGSPVMSIDIVREVVAWLKDFREDRVTQPLALPVNYSAGSRQYGVIFTSEMFFPDSAQGVQACEDIFLSNQVIEKYIIMERVR